MSSYTEIDLSQLPPPDIIEQIDFEVIYQKMKDVLNGVYPMLFNSESNNPLLAEAEKVTDENGEIYFRVPTVVDQLLYVNLESDPSAKILGVCAYRETLLRQRINESIRAVMLAYATGHDLDQRGANYNMTRLVIDPGDPEAIPPIEPTFETDIEFRRRILLVFESLSVAGPAGAYIYHALNADPQVLDAAVESPAPGEVLVIIQARQDSGIASPELIKSVSDYLKDGEIRPLTDHVTVQSVDIVEYSILAELIINDGPDSQEVLKDAIRRVSDYAESQHRIGMDINISGIYAALHTIGVENVFLISPNSDIKTNSQQSPHVTEINISIQANNNV